MKYFRPTNRVVFGVILFWMVAWGVLFPAHCPGTEAEGKSYRVVVFSSKNIRPYVEAVDGLRERLAETVDAQVEVVQLDRFAENERSGLMERFSLEDQADLVAAIGPEAAAFVWETFPDASVAKVYAVILNPEKVIPGSRSAIGISLNIPAADQLRAIRQGLGPSVRRIGIFFDPALNSDFFAAAGAAAMEMDADLVPMAVTSRKDIPFLLEECWDSVDCIWLIPDQTVISESISQYIIKQSVLKNVPVVGYNRFFYDSGAAMAFVFDYEALGRQSADLITDVLRQAASAPRNPAFNVWLNAAVLKKMGIETSQPLTLPMMVGP
jgi:putative ABC transport system substrate-binding protein